MLTTLLSLAWNSIYARKTTAILTVLAVALSVALFLGVEKTRHSARASFENTISGVDAIVGGRTGPINLLLFSVFRIGDPTSPMSWESFEAIANRPDVAWAIPISLGDSHKGYRVLGTSADYFERYKYGQKQSLTLASGSVFDEHSLDVVLGAGVAKELGYSLTQQITLSHGVGEVSFHNHDDHNFTIVGILKPTGTPIDQTIHVSLEAIERIHQAPSNDNHTDEIEHHTDDEKHHEHAHEEKHEPHPHNEHSESHEGHDHHDGNSVHEEHDDHSDHATHDEQVEHASEHHEDNEKKRITHDKVHEEHDHLEPESITAVYVGLKTPGAVLRFNREVNTYPKEALLSIMPGMTLSSLWNVVGSAEKALLGISIFVVLVGLATILISIYTSLNERRREMAILRSIGAGPKHIAFLILFEAAIIALMGSIAGILLIQMISKFIVPVVSSNYGLSLSGLGIGSTEALILLTVPVISSLMALWPASKAMQNALADGLTIRV